MELTKILLNWIGPIDFSKLLNEKSGSIDKQGVYIHCVKLQDGRYAIIYVGESINVYNQNIIHFNRYKTISLDTILFSLRENDELDIEIIHNYDTYPNTEKLQNLIDKNKDVIKVFYAFLEDEIFKLKNNDEYKERSDKYILRAIEGAIQISLWRKSETRKYLLTRISSYNLKKCTLENTFENTLTYINFLGLDKEIKTP